MRLNGMNFGRLVVAIVVVVVLVYYLLLPGTVSRTIKLNKCIRTLVHGQKKLRCNEPFLMNVSEYHAILASFDPSSSSNIVMILFSMFFFLHVVVACIYRGKSNRTICISIISTKWYEKIPWLFIFQWAIMKKLDTKWPHNEKNNA